jgi:hypothetical protein
VIKKLNIMKTLVIILSAIGLISLNSCKQETDPQALMENEETRNEIYETIVADHEYSKQLMQAMMDNEHTQMMMKGDGDMMAMMMSDNEGMMAMIKDNPEMMQGMMSNMMNMAESDSSMCANMMDMMKDKPNMMGQMMDMMHKEGMMDKETLKSNIEKLGIETHGGHH